MAEAHRSMDIAKEWGMNIRQVLTHDIPLHLPYLMVTFQLMSTNQHLLVRLSLDLTSPNGVQSLPLPLMLL